MTGGRRRSGGGAARRAARTDSIADSRAAPAKTDKVQKFLAGITEISHPEERAQSAASHERFEVAGENARTVELLGSGTGLPARFVVGKHVAGALTGHFLLTSDSDTVYAVRADLLALGGLYSANLRERDWMDLTVFKARRPQAAVRSGAG